MITISVGDFKAFGERKIWKLVHGLGKVMCKGSFVKVFNFNFFMLITTHPHHLRVVDCHTISEQGVLLFEFML
jgi:hypothetical protein